MISICTHVYPWHREYYRANELINVLIHSMNKCENKHELELSVVDAGVDDIWRKSGEKRKHGS